MHLEDIIVFLASFDGHMANHSTGLSLLQATGVTLRMCKSKLFYKKVIYMELMMKPGASEIMPDMIREVQGAALPQAVPVIQSFPNCATYNVDRGKSYYELRHL